MCFGAGRYFFQKKKKGGESNIFQKDNSDMLKSFTDRFKNTLGPKAEDIIAEDNKSTREERQRLREAEKTTTREGKNFHRSPTSQ